MRTVTTALIALGSVTVSGAALAQADASGSASFSLSADGASSSADGDASAKGYMSKYRPEDGLVEVGIFGGVLFPSKSHNFQDESRPHQAFKSIAPDIGLRLGYYPLSFLGAELEGAVMPTRTEDDDESAGLWAVRGHVVGQLPMYSIVPFLLAGGGRMGAGSDSMGSDGDPAIHFGAGVKVPLDDFVSLRLDVRDNMTQKNGASDGSQTHHPEILGALTFTLNRTKAAKKPVDSDRDGFTDDQDACPKEPGVAPDGCPIRDADSDGFLDPDDKCPTEAGVAPDGCPVRDSDGDSFLDDQDKCPTEPGIAPDGCPDPDPDKDGIVGAADKCPTEPETKNQYEDDDGCPDEVPEKIKKFTGVIEGIEFDVNKDTIRATSRPTLDGAAEVLNEFPKLRVLITGHTDTDGTRERNLELSKARAESVKKYLASKGVAEARIETRGAGPDEPRESNDTAAGKQKNRRIEFKLLE